MSPSKSPLFCKCYYVRYCSSRKFYTVGSSVLPPQILLYISMVHQYLFICLFIYLACLQCFHIFLRPFLQLLLSFQTSSINPLNPELNPICYLLALLGAHYFLHFGRIRVKLLTLRVQMSYIYMEHPFLMFLDHTQRRSTVGRTPLDE